MPKISIIVPVYNAAQYLHRCIDSILSQSFTDYELLLIDDGSTDESGVICDEYATKDVRIRVFHKKNGGVSSARNLGLDNAKGEWIYFVDADDEVMPNGLQTLVNGISDDVDVVMGGYERYNDTEMTKTYFREVVVAERVSKYLSNIEAMKVIYSPIYYTFLGNPWNKIFRASIIRNYGLYFNPAIYVKEDSLFYIEFMAKSGHGIFFTTTPVYKYIKHNSSVTIQMYTNFDMRFMTSVDALYRMLHVIQEKYPNQLKLIDLASIAIMYQLDRAKAHMKESQMSRLRMLYILLPYKVRTTYEVGMTRFVKYKIHLLIRKSKNFF